MSTLHIIIETRRESATGRTAAWRSAASVYAPAISCLPAISAKGGSAVDNLTGANTTEGFVGSDRPTIR